jgi:glycosyltransferase involved in cell wall biosynthesis
MTVRVSVIVSTLNRPDQVVPCVRDLLANQRAFEIIVVDQSKPEISEQARVACGADPRLIWIQSATRGLSTSRNVAVAAAKGDVFAFTDDDCRIPSDWVSRVETLFTADSELGLLFGAVILSEEDRARGYAAEFEPTETCTFRHVLPNLREPWGIGANMAIRRTVFDAVGLFDTKLGAGTKFPAGEEMDLTIRAITAGFKVMQTPSLEVTHLGVRVGAAASALMRGYGIGLGATLAKHVRLGTPGAAYVLTHWVTLQTGRTLSRVLRGHKQPGFGLLASVILGASRSIKIPIDKARQVYD